MTPSRRWKRSGGSRPRSPGRHGARPLQRQLRAVAGGASRAEQRVPARVRRGRPRLGHRARRQDRAAEPAARRAARGVPRPHLRPSTARRRRERSHGLRPVAAPARGVRRRQVDQGGQARPQRAAGRGAAQVAHHRRRPRGPDRRPRRGDGVGHEGAGDRQRRAARRDEGGGRAVRLRPDAAAVRAPVGRDDEDRRRLPRAAHGSRRRLDGEGQARHRHGEGRRARHRQEPRRHHRHQQRLRGAQPRHQGADRRHARQGQGGRCRRPRHERAAREVDAGHARQPAGDQLARPQRAAGAARRRRAHPPLRRARPPRRLRGSACSTVATRSRGWRRSTR